MLLRLRASIGPAQALLSHDYQVGGCSPVLASYGNVRKKHTGLFLTEQVSFGDLPELERREQPDQLFPTSH